jgi:hypothetical protein
MGINSEKYAWIIQWETSFTNRRFKRTKVAQKVMPPIFFSFQNKDNYVKIEI